MPGSRGMGPLHAVLEWPPVASHADAHPVTLFYMRAGDDTGGRALQYLLFQLNLKLAESLWTGVEARRRGLCPPVMPRPFVSKPTEIIPHHHSR